MACLSNIPEAGADGKALMQLPQVSVESAFNAGFTSARLIIQCYTSLRHLIVYINSCALERLLYEGNFRGIIFLLFS